MTRYEDVQVKNLVEYGVLLEEMPAELSVSNKVFLILLTTLGILFECGVITRGDAS